MVRTPTKIPKDHKIQVLFGKAGVTEQAHHPGLGAQRGGKGGSDEDGDFSGGRGLPEGIKPGDHGTTFGGNPLACAIGRKVVAANIAAQLEQAFLNGFSPSCNSAIATGRFPQISGLKATFTCNGTTPVVTGMWKTPTGISGPAIPIGPSDPVRFVTNDFMYTGGDGYTVLTQGTNVLQPGDALTVTDERAQQVTFPTGGSTVNEVLVLPKG